MESSRIERQDGQSTEQASVIKDSDTCVPTLCCQVARGITERLMKESDHQLTDDGSRVQRVLIKSAEQKRRTHSLSMRRRVKTCTGDKDHDVELVTATHMNPHHSETYRRNTRDRLHVEIDVRTTTAKDTTSVMAKLMVRLESRRLVSPIKDVPTQQVVESNALTSSLGKLNAGSKSMTRAFKLNSGYMELMGSIPRQRVDRQHPSQRSNSENHHLSQQSQHRRPPYLEDRTKRTLSWRIRSVAPSSHSRWLRHRRSSTWNS